MKKPKISPTEQFKFDQTKEIIKLAEKALARLHPAEGGFASTLRLAADALHLGAEDIADALLDEVRGSLGIPKGAKRTKREGGFGVYGPPLGPDFQPAEPYLGGPIVPAPPKPEEPGPA